MSVTVPMPRVTYLQRPAHSGWLQGMVPLAAATDADRRSMSAELAVVRSFVLCRQEPSLLWTPAHRVSIGPVRTPMERGRELVGVCGVCATCGRGRLSRHVRSLSGIYYSAPSRRGLLSD